MELTWHGHSTWYVTVGDTSLLIDPFFDNPFTSLEPSDIETPDFILLTHGHADHIAHAGEFDGATVVGTPELAGYVEAEMGVEDTIGMNFGGTVELGDAFVSMVPAEHTNGINTGYEYEAGVPGGYMISDKMPTQASDEDTTTFYHAGDTSLMTDMREIYGAYYEPDAAALPVGDHFTMGPWQAAIATDWLDVDHVFPMHYNTFGLIEIDIRDFEKEVKAAGSHAEVHVLDGDESFTLE